ncbi:peptidase inhibitor 16-like isoform X1 [Biomphalaria glabrata]|uniref:Peptidase inhibitor 16-like isoform X1 n=1 Tax=Biomphalaria glabrata TaxID=6526 RepID=A0A9W3ATK8_BIOGL|nr:peptidase inhibitor 16-like isoform X1 [Biomphalaria glabrata]XP_055890563.1 peptidase inhibitor 16-like isoform X1 [Biomphalaria glabrata]XP_055890564.1 peptidase inhibitor 16-like isoform X1 [Biomphalaria glabrata]
MRNCGKLSDLPVWSLVLIILFCRLDVSGSIELRRVLNVTSHRLVKRGTNGFSEEEKVAMVLAHNEARAKEGAADMLAMHWDEALESSAQAHTDRCNFEHSTKMERSNIGGHKVVGENLYFSTGKTIPKHALDAWYEEKKDYDFATAICRPGEVCGHYKQVVWAKSYALGCGKKLCSTLTGTGYKDVISNANYITCQYGPAGNTIGRPLYIDGMACSMCPPDRYCRESLCALEAFSRASYQSQLFVVFLLSVFVSLF